MGDVKWLEAVILAGGLGTRISEETILRPKPMVEIGGMPILWHTENLFHHGINEFIICCGYKGYLIKEYFANYFLHMSDVTFDISTIRCMFIKNMLNLEEITLVDTGLNTATGGRLKRVAEYIDQESAFCFSYGDGLSNVNITEAIKFHNEHGKWATIAAVQPPGRYGALICQGNDVTGFTEKPKGDGGFINGGFFVLSPEVLNLIDGDATSFESEPLTKITTLKQIKAYFHDGFWQPMDTLRDRNQLIDLWDNKKAPWKVWS